MTDYAKSTNFTSKDSLSSGNALKIIKGTEFDVEFNSIATAVATKADSINPALSGTPTAPTATIGTNTSQIATTAFVEAAVVAERTSTTTLTNKSLTSPSLTGTPVAPTASVNTSTTQVATTAFVVAQIADDAPTKIGTNASGTWDIAITGNAATATNATTSSDGFNTSQTWQNPSRTYSVVYQNNTGRTIQVMAATRGTSSIWWQVSSDSITWFDVAYATGGGYYHNTSLVIPNNKYYRIDGAATIDKWVELR